MESKQLKKTDFNKFIDKLRKKNNIVAPIEKDILRFSNVEDSSKISLKGHPLFSAKRYFCKPKHDVFQYDSGKLNEIIDAEKIILFGLRLCDINSLLKLDKMFLDENPDEHYRQARENTLIIGLNCETAPKDVCFCESMELKDAGYDLFFCDNGENFHIKVGSKKGEEIVKDLPKSDFKPLEIRTKKKLNKKNIQGFYDDPIWEEEAKKCLSCGACTNLCSTCLCFDIFDEPNLNLSSGKRTFEWDSCQFTDFTKVAGGHVFRDKRVSRLKHRIYHKLQYFKEKFGEDMCTGCGRCIEGCPTKIDFVEIINKIGVMKK